jgi:GNAT superfamily N-acetyltransferase
MTLLIRYASESDWREVEKVLGISFEEYRSLYTADAFNHTVMDEQLYLQRLNEGPFWVGTVNDTVIATLSASVTESGLYIRSMAVLPDNQKRGLALALLEVAEKFAHSRSQPRMYLSTTPFLKRAISLYERFGFLKTSEGPSDLFGTPLFTMEKIL